MRRYVLDNGVDWDTHSLLAIMREHLRGVFAAHIFGDNQWRPKELLTNALQAWQFRNLRAHMYLPSENESLDALRLLADLLDHCGLNSAAGEIETSLVEARDLMGKARMTISPSSTDRATVSLQKWKFE